MLIKTLLFPLLLLLPLIGFADTNKTEAISLIECNLSKLTALELACVSISQENTLTLSKYADKGTFNFNVREIHNEKCGGDPETSPTIAFIEVTDEELYIWHFFCDFVPLDKYSIDMECKD